jgi:hypothetical protein
MLPQHRVAAARWNEERPVVGAFQLQQRRAGDQRREGEYHHDGDHQHRPREYRNARQRHARRAGEQDADDQFDRPGDRGDFDEADPEQPEIRVQAGRIFLSRQGRIHEPAAIGR